MHNNINMAVNTKSQLINTSTGIRDEVVDNAITPARMGNILINIVDTLFDGATIKGILEALSGSDRLSASAINGLSNYSSSDFTTDLASKTLDDIAEGTNAKRFLPAEKTKLAGVEEGATADQTGEEIKNLLFLLSDVNNFNNAYKTKLDAIEENATADQTGEEIVALLSALSGSSRLPASAINGAVNSGGSNYDVITDDIVINTGNADTYRGTGFLYDTSGGDITITIEAGVTDFAIGGIVIGSGQVVLNPGAGVTFVEGGSIFVEIPAGRDEGLFTLYGTGTANTYRHTGDGTVNTAPTATPNSPTGDVIPNSTISAGNIVYSDAEGDPEDLGQRMYRWVSAPDDSSSPDLGNVTVISGATSNQYTIPSGATIGSWITYEVYVYATKGVKDGGQWFRAGWKQITATPPPLYVPSDDARNVLHVAGHTDIYTDVAGTAAAVSGNTVKHIKSQIGAFNAVEVGGTDAPEAITYNSKIAIRFDNQDWLSFGDSATLEDMVHSTDKIVITVMYRLVATNVNNTILGKYVGDHGIRVRANSNRKKVTLDYDGANTFFAQNDTPNVVGKVHVASFVIDPTEATAALKVLFFEGGIQEAFTTYVGAPDGSGQLATASTAPLSLGDNTDIDIDLMHLVITEYTGGDIETLIRKNEGYMAHDYSYPAALDASHPYKSSAP